MAPLEDTETGHIEVQDAVPNNFPLAYFLDYQIFEHCEISIQNPWFSLPSSDFDDIKSIKVVRKILDRFFETIHLWLPILSRRKLYGLVLHQQPRQQDDMNLLVMSMCILTHQQQEGRQRHERIHSMLKHQLIRLEQVGSLSIAILQSI